MRSFSFSSASWQFRDCSNKIWLPATVPGCVHTDLLKAGRIKDPFYGTYELDLQWIEDRDWEYRTHFFVPADMQHDEIVELVSDGLDTIASVVLNGKTIAHTENMFTGYRWNIRERLRPGCNELRIRFRSAMDYIRKRKALHASLEINDPVGGCTTIRKQQCQFGWDWGPRFVTAGIWRDLRLESWTKNRLLDVQILQVHHANGTVSLTLTPELANRDSRTKCCWRLALGDATVDEGEGTSIVVKTPQRWWPAGQGEQPLYRLQIEIFDSDGQAIGRCSRRIGLRTIGLDRHNDEWGQSFQFVVNGRAVFAKGANWIPAHSFVTTLRRANYARDLKAAVRANMNMIRVWGGGIYESEDFYDLCDELGLLVFQDFMFACTPYPGTSGFLANVRQEAAYQVRRIRHHASLALWCGNNEIWSINAKAFDTSAFARWRRAYDKLFHKILPQQVKLHDPSTPYWPASPWRGDSAADHGAGELRGDTHFWDVWHARHPVKDYEKWSFRFVSEFGMQSYSSPATNSTFCPADNSNVFGPVMESHQKNRSGNQIILDYVSRRYRFPKSQDDLIYLSQLNQAHCMQIGVEHYRRLMPRCMGALYWQLNDCWPVASWSSIEFTGRWKALHYVARRFFSPALISAQIHGDEETIIGNYRKSSVRHVHLYTSYDAPKVTRAEIYWALIHVNGRVILKGCKSVKLVPHESARQKGLDLAGPLETYGRENLYLHIALKIDGITASEDSVFLCPPRFVALPRARTKTSVRSVGGKQVEITFCSDVFQHRFSFGLTGLEHQANDNYFDLYPGDEKRVAVDLAKAVTARRVKRALTFHSLVDTY